MKTLRNMLKSFMCVVAAVVLLYLFSLIDRLIYFINCHTCVLGLFCSKIFKKKTHSFHVIIRHYLEYAHSGECVCAPVAKWQKKIFFFFSFSFDDSWDRYAHLHYHNRKSILKSITNKSKAICLKQKNHREHMKTTITNMNKERKKELNGEYRSAREYKYVVGYKRYLWFLSLNLDMRFLEKTSIDVSSVICFEIIFPFSVFSSLLALICTFLLLL